MSFATVSIPQSLLHLPSNRSARAASGKAFALSGWRGGVVGHLESWLFTGLFLTFALISISFALSLR